MLRFVLVGCGRIAKRHADLLGRGQIDGALLAGVCDVDPVRAQYFGEQYGVPWFADMARMFESVEADVAAILTPSGMHPEHAMAAAAAGLHVVVEKPMALRLDDADAMIEACSLAGVRLFVVKQNRFNVPVAKAREAHDQGRFGRLVLGTVRVRWCRDQSYYDQDGWRGTWALDGGVLANQASHHIDLLEWFMGPVRTVHARATTALVRIEAEDTAVATLEFMNGALGVIEATNATRPKDLEGSLSVLGEKGSVVIGGFAVNEMLHWAFVEERPGDADVLEQFSVNPPNVYGYGHQAYYEHVVHCLQTDAPALVDGRGGRRSLELITALYESIETGKQVQLGVNPGDSRLGARPK